jgi:hypothetical protein
MGMEEATPIRSASLMKHASGIERGVYPIFHQIQALGRATVSAQTFNCVVAEINDDKGKIT